MSRKLVILLPLACLLLSAGVAAKDDKSVNAEDQVDYVALASRLIKDGRYDRAAATLRRVDENDETIDRKQLFVLRGLVALEQKLYSEAATAFERALGAGATNPLIHINLGRARFGTKDYTGAVEALEAAGDASESEPNAALLKSRAYWEISDPGEALAVLERAGRRHRGMVEFSRLEILYLLELGLFQELSRQRAEFLDRDDIGADDLAAIGEALRRSGQLEEAQHSLEAGRLRFPDDEGLTVQLARVLMDRGELLSSAMLLEETARLNPTYLIEAAELYRRAGRLERALFINQRVSDQKAKMKQRLQILLELERFEMISAMEARLSRLGLLEDEQIRYALAYGFFQIRDFEAAERQIEQLRDPDLFRKGIELREVIASCVAAGWECQ